jgi:hypothetical protein
LALTGGATTGAAIGAKLTGAGKVIAGKTEIVGGTNGWQAFQSSGTGLLTIAALTANTASITATGTPKPALQASTLTSVIEPSIIQTYATGNNLNIGIDTIIALDAMGSIVLAAGATAAGNGKITILAGGATAGITTDKTPAGTPDEIVESASTGKFVVGTGTAILTADTNAKAVGTVANAAGVLAAIKGSASAVVLQPKNASQPVTLSNATVVTGAP